MEYREEKRNAYVIAQVSADLPVYTPGGFNPRTVLEGRIKHLLEGGDEEINVEQIQVNILDGPEPWKNPVDIAIEMFRADGADDEDIAYVLRRAADELRRLDNGAKS